MSTEAAAFGRSLGNYPTPYSEGVSTEARHRALDVENVYSTNKKALRWELEIENPYESTTSDIRSILDTTQPAL